MAAPVPLAAAAAARPGSLYEALRVGRAATQGEIRAAYRAMAKRLHPDASCAGAGGGGGPEAFLEIRWAYETLSDPAARARYDRSLGAFRGGGGVMREQGSRIRCGGGRPTNAGDPGMWMASPRPRV